MGQYISNGIVIGIEIYSSKKEKKDIKDLEIIKEHLSKYFCLDYYDLDLEKYENAFCFYIKKEMLEDNIHDCIKDFSRLKNPNLKFVFEDEVIDYNSKEFNQDKYPLKLEEVKKYGETNLEIAGKVGFFSSGSIFGDPYWLYRDCNLLGYRGKYRIDLTIKMLWNDYSKISMEDETELLYIMNKMKNDYFKNSLAQCTTFFIDG